VNLRLSALPTVAAAAIAAAAIVHAEPATAQVRRAVPRPAVVYRPPVVVRPRTTVFIGGYYFPTLYRSSLYFGYGYYPRYYAPLYYQVPPYYGYGPYDLSGTVRLQVTPREAEVFIDGYYAGRVDDFDGVFQRLHVEPGEHDIAVYLPGHRAYEQRVYLQPGRTFRIRHTLEPLGPGEPEPVRPAGAPPAQLPAPGPGPVGPAAQAEGRREQGAARFGELSLRVQPGDAEVLIDGEKWEGSLADERLVVQLPAGVHRLEVRKEGFRSYFTDVNVVAGQTRTLNVAMTKQ
jgi:hypothetical protein